MFRSIKAVWLSFSLASKRLCLFMVNFHLFCFMILFREIWADCLGSESWYVISLSKVSFAVLRVKYVGLVLCLVMKVLFVVIFLIWYMYVCRVFIAYSIKI